MTDPDNTDARLQKLEEALAHQSQENHDLSDMVTKQWKLVETLERRLARLEQRLQSIEADQPSDVPAADEKPPHY